MGKEEYVGCEDGIDYQCRERSSVKIVDVTGYQNIFWTRLGGLDGQSCLATPVSTFSALKFGAEGGRQRRRTMEHVDWSTNSASHYTSTTTVPEQTSSYTLENADRSWSS